MKSFFLWGETRFSRPFGIEPLLWGAFLWDQGLLFIPPLPPIPFDPDSSGEEARRGGGGGGSGRGILAWGALCRLEAEAEAGVLLLL